MIWILVSLLSETEFLKSAHAIRIESNDYVPALRILFDNRHFACGACLSVCEVDIILPEPFADKSVAGLCENVPLSVAVVDEGDNPDVVGTDKFDSLFDCRDAIAGKLSLSVRERPEPIKHNECVGHSNARGGQVFLGRALNELPHPLCRCGREGRH